MAARSFSYLIWLALALLIVLALWPALDLTVSGWFFRTGRHFYLDEQPLFLWLHMLGVKGAWVLGIVLALCLCVALVWRRPFLGIERKGWAFLLLALLLGPVLLTNGLLKDHWGRARPHEVTEFGGTEAFTPYFAPQPHARRNGSFVAGDPSLGFFLPSFAYVIRNRRWAQAAFWGGCGVGVLMGLARLAMGGHFLSDILCAALLMFAVSAGLHAVMYGVKPTRDCWRQRLGLHL